MQSLLIMAAFMAGVSLGWRIVDYWLTPKERPMRNITPKDHE